MTVSDDPMHGDDFHLALYVCYELHYRGFAGVDPAWEWEPSLLALRRTLESAFERALRAESPATVSFDVEADLAALANGDGRPLSAYMLEHGTQTQFEEFAIHRSAYQLKEADPHTWCIPRLAGGPKSATVSSRPTSTATGWRVRATPSSSPTPWPPSASTRRTARTSTSSPAPPWPR